METNKTINKIFSIGSEQEFADAAMRVFDFQYHNNSIYRVFCDGLGRNPKNVSCIEKIPFLPISFFKSHRVASFEGPEEIIFTSSATTGSIPSKHYVKDVSVYQSSFKKGFNHFYGNPADYCILALLPSYLERTGSSLIFMAEKLIEKSGHQLGGFFLDNHEELVARLRTLASRNQKTILLGVSFALLDLTQEFKLDFPELIVMETGGMKGRRKEIVREELHQRIKQSFGLANVHSEYGMTELLSQAYSKGEGLFECPPWMKVYAREVNDPLSFANEGSTGGINVIDLGNIYSCSFIATQDLGRVNQNGNFEVLGRFDNSDVRGCNLMV
jgi:phenylacetate-coenzyme A ligase PaaK-like adenylate-forming protein